MRSNFTSSLKFTLLGLFLYLVCSNYAASGQQENNAVQKANDTQLQLGVYYESRCPDSKRFFLNQLIPTYKEIGSIFVPNLIPFGHARVVGSNKMICQHGPRECEGNRLMACIQSMVTNEGEALETIGCLFSNKESTKDCIKKYLPNLSYDELEKCKNSDESFKWMRDFETKTGRVDYIPHLTLDGQSSEEIQTELEQNLKEYLCKKYTGNKPDACKISSRLQ